MKMEMYKSTHIVWHNAIIDRRKREEKNRHKSVVIWFTGLSGSGKSTLSHAVEAKLYEKGTNTIVLDGDNVRHGLCRDLGFSNEDRKENIRRISETSRLMLEAGIITITAFISPFKEDRDMAKKLFREGDFIEIYCRCTLDICEQRDVKGLYKKARAGEIAHFTGISSPYEAPEHPDLTVDTGLLSLEESTQLVMNLLNDRGIIQNIFTN
jgi:adenylylsulfate kinase